MPAASAGTAGQICWATVAGGSKMASSRWQKQHVHFQGIVWGAAAAISIVLIMILLLLGFRIEMAGIIFIVVFVITRLALAFLLNNRYANSMVRILKFDYEELERDFRIVFKNNNIRFFRKSEDDAYSYEFPGRNLNMTVQPHWLSFDMNQQAVTKVTLLVLNAKNTAFAEMLAGAIDEMADRRAAGREET
jgi:hypothetical protein